MSPSLYLYNENAKYFELFLGGLSTIEGLNLIDPSLKATITSFGATCYKKYGWATEKELPSFKTVGGIVEFLKSEGDIGIVEFEANIPKFGNFNTHDDEECHFKLENKHHCLLILKAAIPAQYCDMLINKLLSSPGIYFSCNSSGSVNKYSSFDEYVRKNA